MICLKSTINGKINVKLIILYENLHQKNKMIIISDGFQNLLNKLVEFDFFFFDGGDFEFNLNVS